MTELATPRQRPPGTPLVLARPDKPWADLTEQERQAFAQAFLDRLRSTAQDATPA